MPYGQLVFGHPGSGKTTYCNGMKEYLLGVGRRAVIVNLDPANDELPYEPAVDVRDLVDHDTAMREEGLGPNGAFLFCLEYLTTNQDWLQEELERAGGDAYFLFDCPGQVELYTDHEAFRRLVTWLGKGVDMRLCAVHLVDSLYCRSGPHFISALLMSLSTMLQLELPHVNVLSKIDLLKNYDLDFNLDYYTEVQDLSHLVGTISQDESMPKRFASLNSALTQLVDDYPHVSFLTLDIQSKDSVRELMTEIDRANGFVFQVFQKKKKHYVAARGDRGLHHRYRRALP
eukprot:TRINITY_DN7839_c0_g1_i1.p1 TRINITY_DN7839_c0_g1~~TRINITY_DN7839_c0_g1_i1.p1  ORF type:complete len:287 (+),score=47.42 TRINITY_DN7839_c0_g1_i1:48-908(+)